MFKILLILVCATGSMLPGAFGQTQLLVNSGFESATFAPWQLAGTSGFLSTIGARSGSQCLLLGALNNVNQGVYQAITFPTNLIAAKLSFFYNITTTDPNLTADDVLTIYITDTNQNILATIGQKSNLTPTPGYLPSSTDVVTYTGQTNFSSYAGKTVDVYFNVTTDPVFGGLTSFFLDDVSMVIGTTADIPANDDFTNRTVFTPSVITLNANNTFASKEAGEPNHAGNAGGHSLWWSWTAPSNGIVTLNDTGSSFQTLLAVYTGNVLTNLTQVTASSGGSDGRGGTTTHVSFKVSPGETVAIAADGFSGFSGTMVLNFNFTLDTTPPKVVISSPASGAKLTNSFVLVHGTASDNLAVDEVQYRLENAAGTNDYQVADGTNSWSATATNLIPGPNTVRVRAIDTSSNVSTTVARTFNFVVVSPLTLTLNGNGTVSGAANGQLLSVGASFKIIAKPAKGFGFAGWTGDLTTNVATLSFVMRSNLVLQANFKDITRPVNAVITPKSNQRWSNEVFTVTGKATDNVGVTNVFYNFNGAGWSNAVTLNHWTNWTADLTLVPGTNLISAYAVDAAANISLTNTVKFVYVLSDQLTVTTNGSGTFTPNLNGQSLEIGRNFSMTAIAAKGFAFVNWTGTNGVVTSSAKLTFAMASNLMFTVNFKDITRPVNAILAPTANQTVTTPSPLAAGKATDNVSVSNVWYQINNGSWNAANIAANGTNWSTPGFGPLLLSGSNTINAFAVDGAGNVSLTNSIRFKYIIQPVADWAPDSLNGLLAFVTPSNGSPENVGFDLTTFAQSSTTNSDSSDDSGVGNYTYAKTDTNTAQLSLAFTAPPNKTNDSVGPIDLVFTSHYSGYFTNTDGSGDTGGFSVSIPTNFVSASLAGKTITAVDSSNGKTTTIKLVNGSSFTKTPANNGGSGTSSGTYTLTRFSPVGALLAFTFTSPADVGQVAYVQTTFTNAANGTYFVTSFNLGVLQDTGAGRFNVK